MQYRERPPKKKKNGGRHNMVECHMQNKQTSEGANAYKAQLVNGSGEGKTSTTQINAKEE
jgi:hypothetical protein